MKISDKLKKAFDSFHPHVRGHRTAMEMFLDAVKEVESLERFEMRVRTGQLAILEKSNLHELLTALSKCQMVLSIISKEMNLEWHDEVVRAEVKAKEAINKAMAEQALTSFPLEKVWEASSTVVKTTYNNPESTLIVEFKNGHRYQYSQFPESAWQELIIAESIGSYVQKKLKGNYPVVQL